jgi:hypothetical protein
VLDGVDVVGFVADDDTVGGCAGVRDDGRAQVGADDDGLAVDQVADRADRGQRAG